MGRYTVSTARYEAAKGRWPASRPDQTSDKDGLL